MLGGHVLRAHGLRRLRGASSAIHSAAAPRGLWMRHVTSVDLGDADTCGAPEPLRCAKPLGAHVPAYESWGLGGVRWVSTAPRKGDDEDEDGAGAATKDSSSSEGAPQWLRKLGWDNDSLTVSSDYNRWKVLPAAMLNHLCLGSVFAWSIFNQPLMRLEGVAAQAAMDWGMGDIGITFSLIMGGFAWGALLGKTLDNWGPRASCIVGGSSLGVGFCIGAAAIHFHSLPLLYLGGTIWGLANGWAYVPPVATLMKWFPDRKGFASGSTIMGYGGGAMIAAPLFQRLLDHFSKAPEFLGPTDAVDLVNKGGRLFVEGVNGAREVVIATAADAKASGFAEGVYAVGTGSTGAAETFLCLGIGYGTIMVLSSFVYRLPPSGFVPGAAPATPGEAAAPSQAVASQPQLTSHNVSVSDATRTKQFWLMWTGFGFAITGSYGIISCGKTLLSEAFSSTMPDIVTAGFSAGFVGAMSAANLGGRVFWANASDLLARRLGGDPFRGRQLIYAAMWGIGPPVYIALVWSIHEAAEQPAVLPLAVFCSCVCLALASFGGAAATRPALTGDLFGTKNVGVLTARQLSVVLPAAFAGPRIAAMLRDASIHDAIVDLSSKVTDAQFEHAFGAGKDQLQLLAEQKTVTINRLMEIVPPGTIDPTPFVYDKTMYVMAGLQALAFLSNMSLRPVDPSLHEPEPEPHVVHNPGMHDVEDSFIGEGDRGWVADTHDEPKR